MNYPKRLIEVDLPIKRISAHARREKSIRHGHISTLHIWWARRPLAACRAVICAALWPDPAPGKTDAPCPPSFIKAARKEMLTWTSHDRQHLLSAESRARFEAARQKPKRFDDVKELRGALLDFIADFANWDNSTVREYLDTSRALTQAAHEALGGAPGTRPLVVDPFCGGGSIPLEALRVGADAFASDLNPIPVLLNKVVLEYVPKYGQRLADEVRKWGEWIKREAEKELSEFYPKDLDGSTAIGYLWARTILSEAPGQGDVPVEVPLIRSMWLAKRTGRNRLLKWSQDAAGQLQTVECQVKYADGTTRRVLRPSIEITSQTSLRNGGKGTSSSGAATCPISAYTTPVENVRKQLESRRGGASDARPLCVVLTRTGENGRIYRVPALNDQIAYDASVRKLNALIAGEQPQQPLIPEGELNHLRGFFNVVLYGMKRWRDLFSPRQLLSLIVLVRLIRKAGSIINTHENQELSMAVQTCLSLALDRYADYGSSLCGWVPSGEFVGHTFGRQALPMIWDYVETNPLSSVGWSGACEWVSKVIESIAIASLPTGSANLASATSHPLPDDTAEAIVTDPPYYAAIPYADLSDFFYSWLKRSVGDLHPGLFGQKLAPKDEECVSLAHRAAMYRHKDNSWFESKMTVACAEARRVAKPSGIGVFVFANKETSGWEAMLSALVESGWVVTASWPIDTEMGARLRAQNSAVLASSVHLVCRPRENIDGTLRDDEIGDWRDVLQELPRRIHEWMPRLAEEGVVGADAIFACLGPALEIFSRYSRVEKASGETVMLKEYLEQVWAAVAKEALTLVFSGADTTGFEPDARLTAMWLWTLTAGQNGTAEDAKAAEKDETNDSVKGAKAPTGFTLEYDAARKIAQGLGANLEQLDSLVQIKGDIARLLPVAERARYLFGKDEGKIPRKRRTKEPQMDLFKVLEETDEDRESASGVRVSRVGDTVLDRIHQSMILFAAGRGEALKRFLVEDGAGRDQRFWKLAQALSALYPSSTEEKRWIDGVLARKKGLGF